MPKSQIPTPAIPSSRFRPQGGPLFVRTAAWVCLLCSDTPPLAPGAPLRVNDLTLGHGAEGMCAKSSPQGTRGCLQSGRRPR